MFIQTETTPNPATLKFIPGKQVMPQGTANFDDPAKARSSFLAESLFEIEGVSGVFFGADFITVTKTDDASWDSLKPQILGTVMEHFQSGKPILNESISGTEVKSTDDTTRHIIELIETRVRPAVAQDGGDIIFKSFEDGIVYLQMQGACSGCPSSTATLKHGIERMLQHYVPEVLEVRPFE